MFCLSLASFCHSLFQRKTSKQGQDGDEFISFDDRLKNNLPYLFSCRSIQLNGKSSKMASAYQDPARANPYQSTKRFDNLQADVNQVVDVMKDNLDKVLERDSKLSHLENRADMLQTGASQFTTNAGKLKRKYWWKNVKMWGILILVVIILIIIIIVAVTQSTKSNNSNSGSNNSSGR